MEKFYLQIGVRIPNCDLGKMLELNSVELEKSNPGFKSKFTKYSESTRYTFKVESNIPIPNLSFLRISFEKCLGVEIDDLSLSLLSHNTFLEKKELISDNASEINEIDSCVKMVRIYQKKLKTINVKDFNFDDFKSNGDKFIELLEIAHRSPKTHLEKSDFKFFTYNESGDKAILTEIDIDSVK